MQKDPYANAVGTVCIPNFLMLQATLAGSTPAFAGEFSVFHTAVVGREWLWLCSIHSAHSRDDLPSYCLTAQSTPGSCQQQ